MWKEFSYDDLLKVPPQKKPCFLKGTMVLRKDGLQPIEEIVVGDMVLSYNQKNKTTDYKRVTYLHNNYTLKFMKIFTTNGHLIQATGKHLFFVSELKKWIPVSKLKIGMSFLNNNLELVKISKLEIIESRENTFNLEVEDNHNYFVGEDKVLTHNGMSKSIFNTTTTINVNFYALIERRKDKYIGQTIQVIADRFKQHKKDLKTKGKKKWMSKISGFDEIPVNGNFDKMGPYKMTPYEAAVTEMYELNVRGGKKTIKNPNKDLLPLENRQNPIGKKKFEYFKKNFPEFNPCKFYA